MKWISYVNYVLLVCMLVSMSSCSVVEGIFKAGMWTTVILIVLVVGLIFYLFRRLGS